jgi:hypothetical protein
VLPPLLAHAGRKIGHRRSTHVSEIMGLQPAARGPLGCVMRPVATFVNCIHTKQIVQLFLKFGIPLIATSTLAALRPAHNDGCGPFTKMF